MNQSVDPCDNFYQYACGNYKTHFPIDEYDSWTGFPRNVLSDLSEYNEKLVEEIIQKPVSTWHFTSSERKIKEFFESCNDMFQRQQLRGQPFLAKVVAELGGWKLLGTWNSSTWDWHDALKKVQVDYWTDAFYVPEVGPDWYDSTRRVIVLHPSGTGKYMFSRWYTSTSPYVESYKQDYKKFVRRVAEYLVRDARELLELDGMPDKAQEAELIEEFVNDTFTIESNIAHLDTNSPYDEDPYHDSNKVTLSQLTSDTGNIIDWVEQMAYMFNTADITGSTKIVMQKSDYFTGLTEMIRTLPEETGSRMLHNYFIWRVAETYVQELSWEYIHANREIFVDLNYYADFMGIFKYCHNLADKYMQDALSALYIKELFDSTKRTEVHAVTDNMKKAALSQLDKTPWMDETTKQIAREKIENIIFKMGYPDWTANMEIVDNMYSGVDIDVTDFFGSILSLNQFHRQQWNQRLNQVGEDRQEWNFPLYWTHAFFNPFWNEIAVTAGMLQIPVYDPKQPFAATFGSLGAMLGEKIHHSINEWGQFYDKHGNYLVEDSWWSNATTDAYSDNQECVENSFKNFTKKIVFQDGTEESLTVDLFHYTGEAMAYTTGIRLALIAYRDWLESRKMSEKSLPGVELTNEQMVFLAHAQTHCFNTDPMESYWKALFGELEDDDKLNIALGQLPEFSKAFNCKEGSNMNHGKLKTCEYY